MLLTLRQRGRAAIVNTRGGELSSYQDEQSTEYIWQGDPNYWAGQNPILFPFLGTLMDGAVRFDGVEYRMDKHGFAKKRSFSLVEQGEDFAVLELREDPKSLAGYPYPFVLRVRHALVDGGYSTAVTVTNPGEKAMPFCLGLHPAFCCPLDAEDKFEDYELLFETAETCPTLVPTAQGCLDRGHTAPFLENTNRVPLKYDYFNEMDTLIFEGLRAQSVRLQRRDGRRGVQVDFQGFPVLAFWTMPGVSARFLCIEPWHGLPAVLGESGEFRDKPHCITLLPGESRTLQYRVNTI